MAFLLGDHILESSVTSGTGPLTLSPVTGYDEFEATIGAGNTTWYLIEAVDSDGAATGDWEAGEGTVGVGTISRDTVFKSSNAGALVDFANGNKRVWCNVSADKFLEFASGTVTTVSVTTANGFSGSVLNPSTTPAITISISNAATVRTSLGLGTAALNDAGDFDAAGLAAAAYVASQADLAAHVAAPDPHPQYLTTAEGNAAYQPLDATLTAFAALTIAANSLTVGTGADAFSQVTFAANTFPARSSAGDLVAKTITDFALTILDDANAAAVLTTIGAQPLDGTLTAFAALTIAAESLTIGTGADSFSQTTFAANTFPARASAGGLVAKTITDFGLSLVDDANAAAGRTTLDAQQLNANLTSLAGLTFAGNGLKGVRVNGAGNALELAAINAATATIANTTSASTHRLCFALSSGVPGDLPILVNANMLVVPSTGLLAVLAFETDTLSVFTTSSFTGTAQFFDAVTLGSAGGNTGSLKFKGTTSGTVTFTVGAAAGTHTIKLPGADGSANQYLKTDGSGNWGWATLAATPAGTVITIFVATASVSSTTTAETKSMVGTGTGSMTISANTLTTASVLRLKARGVFTTAATQGTLNILVKLAGTTVASTGAQVWPASRTHSNWEIEVDLVFRTVGAAGLCMIQGMWGNPGLNIGGATANVFFWPIKGNSADPPATVTVDTTASMTVDIQSVTSNANNTFTTNHVQLDQILM